MIIYKERCIYYIILLYNMAKVVDLCSELETSYEGDAKAEINMFLVNLSRHIYRLALFYSKMASFVTLTSQSLKNSDNKMVENIEG